MPTAASEWHGEGTFETADGERYVGQWEQSERHGKGTHKYADGKRTPRGIYAHQHAHYASKIRPGPGIPPGYIVPIAKRSPPHRLRASPFHATTIDPFALRNLASRSLIFLGREGPRV